MRTRCLGGLGASNAHGHTRTAHKHKVQYGASPFVCLLILLDASKHTHHTQSSDRRCHGPKCIILHTTICAAAQIWAMNLFLLSTKKIHIKTTTTTATANLCQCVHGHKTERTRKKSAIKVKNAGNMRAVFIPIEWFLNMTNVTARYTLLGFTFNKIQFSFRFFYAVNFDFDFGPYAFMRYHSESHMNRERERKKSCWKN